MRLVHQMQISLSLKSSFVALTLKIRECENINTDLKEVVLDEIENDFEFLFGNLLSNESLFIQIDCLLKNQSVISESATNAN